MEINGAPCTAEDIASRLEDREAKDPQDASCDFDVSAMFWRMPICFAGSALNHQPAPRKNSGAAKARCKTQCCHAQVQTVKCCRVWLEGFILLLRSLGDRCQLPQDVGEAVDCILSSKSMQTFSASFGCSLPIAAAFLVIAGVCRQWPCC